jgi:hypothetical protein
MGLGQFIGAFAEAAAPAPIVVAPPSWQRRLRRWALRKAWRMVCRIFRRALSWGRALAPWYLALTVWLAAAIAGQVENGWRTLVALALVGAAPMYRWLGLPLGRLTKRRKVKPTEQRCWYAGFYVLLSVWSAVGAAWTVLPPWAGVLWLGTFATWVRWMWHRRTRRVEVLVGEIVDDRLTRWARIAGEGKPLKGAELENLNALEEPRRWTADVVLPSGDLTVENVQSAHRRICSAFSTRRDNIIIDESPGGAEDAAVLTVVEENPTHTAIEYDEGWQKEFAPGCFGFHTYGDGFRGGLRLWQPMSGTANTLFSGDTRAGKSAGMEAGLIQAVDTGLVWPMAGDPQGGQSMPAVVGEAGWAKHKATDPESVYNQLLALKEAMYARSRLLQRMKWSDADGEHVGIGFYDPQVTGLPMILYIFDEAHIAMKDPDWGPFIVLLVEELVRMVGKTGIALWLATQYPGIEDLGNKMSIRQNLIAGNVVSYKNSAAVAKGMILPASMPSPYQIPKETPDGGHTKGTAVIYSAAPRSSRSAYSRSVWVKRAHHFGALAAAKIPVLDEVTGNAMSRYIDLPGSAPAAKAVEPQRERIVVAAAPARKERAIDRIVAYLDGREDGRAHTGVIAEALDMPKGTVGMTLRRAEASGAVHKVRDGVWALGRATAEAGVAA